MPRITLAAPWPYRTPLVSIDFPPGEHDVSDDIAAAALASPDAQAALIETETEESANGDGIAAPRAPRRAGKAKG